MDCTSKFVDALLGSFESTLHMVDRNVSVVS